MRHYWINYLCVWRDYEITWNYFNIYNVFVDAKSHKICYRYNPQKTKNLSHLNATQCSQWTQPNWITSPLLIHQIKMFTSPSTFTTANCYMGVGNESKFIVAWFGVQINWSKMQKLAKTRSNKWIWTTFCCFGGTTIIWTY